MGLLNPITTVLPLRDSLQGRDRDGLFSATATGPVRYREEDGVEGYWAEEGTTNLVLNPLLRTNATGWGNQGSTAISRVDTTATLGEWSIQIVRDGSGDKGFKTHSSDHYAVTAGLVYTASFYAISSPAVINAVIRIDWFDSGGSSLSNSIVSDQTIGSDAGNPSRLVITATAPANAVSAAMYGYTTSGSVSDQQNYTKLAFEQKGHATSFCPQLDPLTGNPMPGYSWAATPHASASVRAATVLTFDPAGRVDNDSFAMVGRFSLDSITDGWQAIASAGKQDIGNFFGVFNRDDGRFSAKSNGGYAEDSLTFTPGSPQIAYVAGKDTDWIGQLDDNTPITDTRPDGGAWSNSNVYIGSTNNGDYLNGSVGPIAFYDRPLTDVELDKVKAAISLGRNPWGLLAPKKQYSFFQLRPGV